MNSRQAIQAAVDLVGLKPLAMELGCSYQNVQQWLKRGRLPRTDYSGETNYASRMAAACKVLDPDSTITREALLGLSPITDHRSPFTASEEAAA